MNSPPVAVVLRHLRRLVAVQSAVDPVAFLLVLTVAVGVTLRPAAVPAIAEVPESKPAGPPRTVAGAPVRPDHQGDALPDGAVARLGTVRLRHGERVWSVAFSPDGQVLASGGHDGYVNLWDVATGKRRATFTVAQQTQIDLVSLASDGKSLLAASRGGPFALWDLSMGKQRLLGGLDADHTICRAVSPDNKTLVLGGLEGKLRFWDLATGAELPPLDSHGGPRFWKVVFSHDGKVLATVDQDDSVRLWDVATRQEKRRPGQTRGRSVVLTPCKGTTMALAFTRGGDALAVGVDNAVGLVDLATGKYLRWLEHGPTQGSNTIFAIAVAPDGRSLATASSDKTVCLWDAATGKKVRTYTGHHADVLSVAFSPDGKTLASGGWDNTVRVWDVASGRERFPVPGHQHGVRSVVYSPDGRRLASASAEGTLCLWDAASAKALRQWTQASWIKKVQFSPDGRFLASSANFPAPLRLWDVATGKELHRFGDKDDANSDLCFAPDGRTIVTRGGDSQFCLWDAGTCTRRKHFEGPPEGALLCFAYSPDGKTVATGDNAGKVLLWDPATGTRRALGAGHDGNVEAVAFAPDGKTVASACPEDQLVVLWDVATGKPRRRFEHAGRLEAVAFAPDGWYVASGGADRTVSLWEVATGKECGRFTGHRGEVCAVAFAPDGRSLASASTDTTVLLWDLTGRCEGPAPAGVEALWAALADADAARARRAVWALSALPERAVPYLRERLRPVAAPDAGRVRQLIADLGSDHFTVRRDATAELEQLGELAEAALRAALATQPALEAHRRLERLLGKIEGPITGPEKVRALRAVAVLEHSATPGARRLLETLGRGAPAALVTQAAQGSLRRLGGRTGGGTK
jgi:WD40 repeat protein